MTRKKRYLLPYGGKTFLERHSLGLVVGGLLALWALLYALLDAKTHLGMLLGNMVADWLGLFVTVIGTKFLYEQGSAESRSDPHPPLHPLLRILKDHSLTWFLIASGIGWALLYVRIDAEAKWGEVVGNIVSEWTQQLGVVLLTKRLIETHSKESRGQAKS